MYSPLQKKKGKAAEPEPEPEPEPAPEEPPPEPEPPMENVDLGGGSNDAPAEANPDDMWGFATTGKKKKGKKGKVSLVFRSRFIVCFTFVWRQGMRRRSTMKHISCKR